MKDEKSSASKTTKKLVFVNTAKIIHELQERVRVLEAQLEETQSKQKIPDLERPIMQMKAQQPIQNPIIYCSSLFFSGDGKLTQLLIKKFIEVKDHLGQALINHFFQSIYLRDFDTLETLLVQHPNLVHAISSPLDPQGVECHRVTGFQYAVCLRDFQIWSLMVNTPTITNRLSDINIQHQFQAYLHERHDLTSRPSVFLTIEDLCSKLTLFSDNFHHWSYAESNTYLLEVVSKAQKLLPYWIIYPMMEEGQDVAWITQDFTKPIKYNSSYLQNWNGNEQRQLGNEDSNHAFAWCRGRNSQPSHNLAYCFGMGTGIAVEHDVRNISILSMQAEHSYNHLVDFCIGVNIEEILMEENLEVKTNIHPTFPVQLPTIIPSSKEDSYFTELLNTINGLSINAHLITH